MIVDGLFVLEDGAGQYKARRAEVIWGRRRGGGGGDGDGDGDNIHTDDAAGASAETFSGLNNTARATTAPAAPAAPPRGHCCSRPTSVSRRLA